MTFDSKDEEYIYWWLEELKQAGFIKSITRGKSYELNKPLVIQYSEEKVLKTKNKLIDKKLTLVPIKVYTPDFEVIWTDENSIFNIVIGKYRKGDSSIISLYKQSTIEVKPVFDHHNMTRLFKTNQAIMWDKYEIYVNLVMYEELFENTFTPNKFLLTEKTMKQRKIKWKVKSLKEFINS